MQRLTTAVQQAALPMTIHISEVVYNKIKVRARFSCPSKSDACA
jgi:hypothetical protein